ncbi:MAG: hypothetical protein A2751_02835 [Candidatus Doudnabacteria bacterium RIFCSPHIGHO2_01_FULL_46_14]|uniref:SLC26A/SulP transporter domain-containing protein n=1 Tax=Candidatus Doudnabacteria bacterium RIFCSPHIGHO2_01_FULL_46_14 TaxID=1817824 RepID=A0A1F5NK91_9BACT|nr:MAG: hypothetical protein A2751_02835 [Candidatus Doudnabacteria bacterium RIFCSPHIGHO2_01_FULL_46_14]
MRWNKNQTDLLADYFSDLSKILFASAIVGFFVPSSIGQIGLTTFAVGTLATVVALVISLMMAK